MPMTEQGFRKYTYAELLEQQIIRAKDLFGDDIDTSGKSVLGKYIRLNVSDFAQQEEALEALYQARYVDTACGVSLDRLAPFAGLQRNAAVATVLALVLYCLFYLAIAALHKIRRQERPPESYPFAPFLAVGFFTAYII